MSFIAPNIYSFNACASQREIGIALEGMCSINYGDFGKVLVSWSSSTEPLRSTVIGLL